MNDTLVDIELPFPPSQNNGYRAIGRGRVTLSKTVRAYKDSLAYLLNQAEFNIPPKTELGITFFFYCSSAELHIRDWDGLPKFVQDSIFAANKPKAANDAWVMEAGVKKIRAEGREPYCRVIISILRTREGVS